MELDNITGPVDSTNTGWIGEDVETVVDSMNDVWERADSLRKT